MRVFLTQRSVGISLTTWYEVFSCLSVCLSKVFIPLVLFRSRWGPHQREIVPYSLHPVAFITKSVANVTFETVPIKLVSLRMAPQLYIVVRVRVQCCFTSTETLRTIRDWGGGGGGGGGTATSTFTQLLNSQIYCRSSFQAI